jgi:predicted small lipoprotein YifL
MLISRIVLAGIFLLLTLTLQGCGRKGPLFMPQAVPAQPAPAVVNVQAASTVVPAPSMQNPTTPTQPETK